jgi:hypothetical protein
VDLPQTVTLPDVAAALGTGWKELLRNTNGQFGLALILNRYLRPSGFGPQMMTCIGMQKIHGRDSQVVRFNGEPQTASQGWDGDAYAVLENGDRQAGVMALTFDTPADATEFAGVYAKVLQAKYGTAGPAVTKDESGGGAEAPGRLRFDVEGRGACAVDLLAMKVFVAECVPADRLDAVMKALKSSTFAAEKGDLVPAQTGK